MTKTLTIFLAIYFSIIGFASATPGDTVTYAPMPNTINPLYASPISAGQNNKQIIISNGNNSSIDYQIKETISDGKTTVYIGYANGLFYANGNLIGTNYKISKNSDGIKINDRLLSYYSFPLPNNDKNEGSNTNPRYYQAYTKFLLGDYKSTLSECDAILASDASNLQTSLLRTVAKMVLDKKITPEEAQSKIDKILKSAL